MLIIFSLIAIVSAKVDISVKLPLEEAEKLNGSDLFEYVRRHQKLFEVQESKEAEERLKYLMDSKYLVAPDDKDRIKIELAENEELPASFSSKITEYSNIVLGVIVAIKYQRITDALRCSNVQQQMAREHKAGTFPLKTYSDLWLVAKSGPEHRLLSLFDAREKWPQCAHLIGRIRDQTSCGSCWAVSAAAVMTDRACVQSNGRVQAFLSDTDILSCCGSFCGYGCRGGYDIRAWEYININGVCTGGPYGTKGACKPYVFHPCGRHRDQIYYGECPAKSYETPKCSTICQRGYGVPYKKDKFYAKNFYWLPNDEKLIRKEIMTNGPVQASFDTYADIKLYKKGVYKHTAGERVGGHAIRIVGWGTDESTGEDYWLIANSWNVDWGEDGYFRMIRGTNECRIEELAKAGMMDV